MIEEIVKISMVFNEIYIPIQRYQMHLYLSALCGLGPSTIMLFEYRYSIILPIYAQVKLIVRGSNEFRD